MDCLLGRNGFIGSKIAGRLVNFETIPNKDCDRLFFFGSPSSVIQFEKNIHYCVRETVNSFLSLLEYCSEHGIYLVYPSSATVYNKNNAYARTKAVLEELHLAYNIPALGLRISAAYGPNESHKGKYASVIYQWIQMMKKGERPVIWGDGTQTRDFIFIDDAVDEILSLASKKKTGIVDIGTGVNTSLNEVVATINKVLGTSIEPIYIDKPNNYIQHTPVKGIANSRTLEKGIRLCLKSE